MLQSEIDKLDMGIADAHVNEEHSLQKERREDYATLKAKCVARGRRMLSTTLSNALRLAGGARG